MLVALRSLPSGTLLNIAGFGTDVKPLFPSSRLCSNVSAAGQSPSHPPSPCPLPAPSAGSGGPLQVRLSVRAGDTAACLRAPRRAASRHRRHQPAGGPGLGAGAAPPPRLPPPALPLHRRGGGQRGQDSPAAAQAGQHHQVRHRCGVTVLSVSPPTSPSAAPNLAPRVSFTHHSPQCHRLSPPDVPQPGLQPGRHRCLSNTPACPCCTARRGFSSPGSLPQVLQLRHGPTGVPVAAEGHGQGEPGPRRVPEPG